MLRNVAGGRVHVKQILQPNSDPHAYEPRPSDAKAVTGANLIVRSGGDLDDWLGDLLRNAGSDAKTVTLIDAVRAQDARGRPVSASTPARDVDPHWWQSPANGILAVDRIRDALVAMDPDGRAAYTANAARYVGRLRALDRAIARCMTGIPAARRKIVTDHDALGYYAKRYRIVVIGAIIPALTTQAQPSAGATARLVRTIRRAGVRTIFVEASVNEQLAQAIARESGAQLGQSLYGDSLGPRGSSGATYFGSIRANSNGIVAGITGGDDHCHPHLPDDAPAA
jgi:ABC-type Zn uptake system ZnuABC Zn-binding protein ZnuA